MTLYEIHGFHKFITCLDYNLIQLFLQLESKFIGDICIPLNHGKLSPNLEGPIGEPSEESGGNNVVERIYRASLSLKDYFTNILISLVVQMSFTRNKVNGSSKVYFQVLLVAVATPK